MELPRQTLRGLTAGFLLGLAVVGTAFAASASLPDDVLDLLRHRDYGAAVQALQPLASQGNSEAQYQLGRLYQRGLGVPRNERQAIDYFELAAGAGHVESAYLLGTLYERGGATPKDEARALHWLHVAADSGHELAARKLAERADPGPTDLAAAGTADEHSAPAEDGLRALCSAAERKDLTALNRLVEAGADVRARDASGGGVLHCAVRSGSEAVVGALLRAGAPVQVTDAAGDTPLHLAVASGTVSVTRMLLEAGADAQAMNVSKWSPRMLAERGGNATMMQLLGVRVGSRQATLDHLDVAAQSSSRAGWSKLALASWAGELNLAEALISRGAAVNAVDASGHTAAYRAVQANRPEVLKLLVRHGASLGETSADGTLLHIALRAGHDDVARVLLANAPLQNVADAQGQTPLLLAISLQNAAAAKLLLERGADVNAGTPPPLVAAAKYDLGLTVAALLEAGAQPDAVDRMGRSALWWAARSGTLEIARSLLAGHAVNRKDSEGVAPWHVSAKTGNAQMLELLAANVTDLNEPTASGNTALLLAAENGNLKVVESLLARGAKVDVKNKVGDTALICAVRNAHKGVAARLVAAGANPRMRNLQNTSALDLAERTNDPEWVQLLKDQRGWFDVLMSDA